MKNTLLPSLLALCLINLAVGAHGAGKLLIVGGGLSDDTHAIHQAFLDALPSPDSKVAIVPLASSNPVRSANSFKKELLLLGAESNNIRVLRLAMVDDKSTAADESLWAKNAWNLTLAAELQEVDGFWFVGGDQMRIIEALQPQPNEVSPVLKTLRLRLQDGAVIGGTSAGAAIMSQPMVAAGDSFSALTLPAAKHYSGLESQEQGQLYLHHGLGFFPYGIIDQHFDRKARLGRLARTLAQTQTSIGYGVDEDTAMLVDLDNHQFEVVGHGNVTVLDSANADFSEQPFSAHNLQLSVLGSGDRFDLQKRQLLPTEAQATIGKEYADDHPVQGAGLALPNARLSQLLGYQLLDNAGATQIDRYSFDASGAAVRYRFRQQKNSQGYWRTVGSADLYGISQVAFDIEPVNIKIIEPPATDAIRIKTPSREVIKP